MQDSIEKEKNGVKNVCKFVPLRGGGRRLMAKTILNFQFDYWNPSLNISPNNMREKSQWSYLKEVGGSTKASLRLPDLQ